MRLNQGMSRDTSNRFYGSLAGIKINGTILGLFASKASVIFAADWGNPRSGCQFAVAGKKNAIFATHLRFVAHIPHRSNSRRHFKCVCKKRRHWKNFRQYYV